MDETLRASGVLGNYYKEVQKMENFNTDQRQEIVSGFLEKLKEEMWFDRPTILHGHWSICFQILTYWVVTGKLVPTQGIRVVVNRMLREYVESLDTVEA